MNDNKDAIDTLELLLKNQKISQDAYEQGLDRVFHIESDVEEGIISENRIVKNYTALKNKLLESNPIEYVKWLLQFYYISVADNNSNYKQSTDPIVKILNVQVVSGSSLKSSWHSSMQVISTSEGDYIDVLESNGGYNWSSLLQSNVQVNIKSSAGYEWIKFMKQVSTKSVQSTIPKQTINIHNDEVINKIKKYDLIINTPNSILDVTSLENIDASSLIIKCGKIIEKIISNIYKEKYNNIDSLYNMIKELEKINFLDKKITAYAHFIRSYRNIESHPNAIESTKDDMLVVLLSLTQFIESLEKNKILKV